MKTVFAFIALFVAGAFAQLTINTPSNVVECEPTQITWSGGTPPYTVSVMPGASPNGPAIESFNATSATSMTWICNQASGTSLGLNLRDSTGAIAQSASFTVGAGTTSSCLNSTSVVAGSTGAVASTGAAPTAGATTTKASTGTATTASGSAATASSASSGTSGASANVAEFGVAGVVGAAVAALFL